MKKETFIKSTIILMIGGLLTKLLGILIKVIMTRNSNLEIISLYMLVMPTFSLMMAISQLGFATGISKVVSENKESSKKILFSILPVSFFINIILTIFLIFTSHFIAFNLLKNEQAYLPILAISLVLPFDSLSSILRGFFFGKEKMIPHVISNISEQIVRLLFMIIILPKIIYKGIIFVTTSLILINVLSELVSSLVLIFFLPKQFKIERKDLKPSFTSMGNVLGTALPTTATRIIGTISFFFEPIILTFFLLKNGYSNSFIINEYGILNGYVMPLLLLPSFFTLAISQALIPVVSNSYANNNIDYTKKKIKQALFFSLLIGIPATLIFIFIPNIPLKLIYNTEEGLNYIKFLAPICLLHYIQSPISSSLQAIGKAKDSMMGTLYGMIIRTTTLIIGCNLKIGLWGLILATASNIIFVTIYDLKKVKKSLNITQAHLS